MRSNQSAQRANRASLDAQSNSLLDSQAQGPLKHQRRQIIKGGAATVAAGLGASMAVGSAKAQAFPARPITLYCAFPASGPTDLVMRAIAEAAGKLLGQNIVVENKAGAGGTLAALAMKPAKNDGYTLAQMPLGLFRIPHMQKQAQFDPIKDFTYITCLTGYTFGLAIRPDLPFSDLKGFIAWAKANPEKLTYGHTGIGTSPHLAMEEFAQKAGIKLNAVPFRGNADLMQAILGGHVMSASDSTGWAPHVDAGKLKLIATYGSKRTKRWSNVATLAEQGYETVSDSPFGVGGPAGMDAAVIRTLNHGRRQSDSNA
jgi:tripartite-type tricarboxylate transporter receptor subunit TctC